MSSVELSPASLPGYVDQVAPKYGLDPAAVLAVASQEGLGGGIGDQGTSFGPWQLHAGGALPPQEYGGPGSAQTNRWAWSTSGVDYALAQMSQAAQGLSGVAAIEAIVTGFERPANPSKEVQGASGQYGVYASGQPGGSSSGIGFGGASAQSVSFQPASLGGAIGGITIDIVLRLAFVLGALVFGGVALVLLVRAFGGNAAVPVVAKVADTVTPTGRAVREASRESRVAVAAAPAARERRAEEAHQARVGTQKARTTEVRSRSRRKATEARRSREAEFNRGYVERATEEASPNLSRARASNRNKE